MGIRQTLNEKPAIITGAAIAIIVLALIAIIYQATSKPSQPKLPTQAYYSDDDGKTWFVDDINKVPPFDHGGKMAFRAVVVRCGEGKPFVWRLEGYDEQERQQIEEAMKNSGGMGRLGGYSRGLLMKHPGDPNWFTVGGGDPNSTQIFTELMQPMCPDGNSMAQIVPASEHVKP